MNKLIKRSLTINAISNWLSFGLNILISFLLTPFIIKYLNIAGYGVWTIVSSVIGYYGLLDLGVTSAVIRYVALYLGQKDSRAFNEIISTSISIFCIIGVIVSVFSFFFQKY